MGLLSGGLLGIIGGGSAKKGLKRAAGAGLFGIAGLMGTKKKKKKDEIAPLQGPGSDTGLARPAEAITANTTPAAAAVANASERGQERGEAFSDGFKARAAEREAERDRRRARRDVRRAGPRLMGRATGGVGRFR